MAAFRGVQAHKITRALNRITPGVTWTHCSKGYIADAYARPSHHGNFSLDELKADVAKGFA